MVYLCPHSLYLCIMVFPLICIAVSVSMCRFPLSCIAVCMYLMFLYCLFLLKLDLKNNFTLFCAIIVTFWGLNSRQIMLSWTVYSFTLVNMSAKCYHMICLHFKHQLCIGVNDDAYWRATGNQTLFFCSMTLHITVLSVTVYCPCINMLYLHISVLLVSCGDCMTFCCVLHPCVVCHSLS